MALGNVTIEWYGDEFTAETKAFMMIGLAECGVLVADTAKDLVSVQEPVHVDPDTGVEYFIGPHSKKGMPPHRETGRLQENIRSAVGEEDDSLYAEIGSEAKNDDGYDYPAELQKDMDRPFLVPALMMNENQIIDILTTGF